jgi:succinate dehydrogenase / fumarate reductase cytochrome b subunit
MASALTLSQTTVGKKAVVAVTGLIMFGFLIGHLSGNLLVLLGQHELNAYAEFLHRNPEIIWPARIVLLLSVVTHVALIAQLGQRNQAARSHGYRNKKDQLTTYAARTMYFTGPLLLVFIVFHLIHFTVGSGLGQYAHNPVHHGADGEMQAFVYANVVQAFQVWWVAAIYVFANLMLALHLVHGVWSATQSIGASHPRYHVLRRNLTTAAVAFVAGGNVLLPLLILSGVAGNEELELSPEVEVAAEVAPAASGTD